MSQRRWHIVALLLLVFYLLVGGALRKSATVDEQQHIFRGVAYLKANATHFLLGHPLGNSLLSAALLLTENSVTLPSETQAWAAGNWAVASGQFLWHPANASRRMLFLARLPTMWTTLLLGCFVYVFGRKSGTHTTGLLAAMITLLDPNLLAHGRYVTGDAPLATWFVLTIFGSWLTLRRQQFWRGAALAAIGLGMSSVTKFNAALLLPIVFLLVSMSPIVGGWRSRFIWLLSIGGGASLLIWLVYGVSFDPLPAQAFWDDLRWQFTYLDGDHGGYLFGNSSAQGWRIYFPIAYLLKTPLMPLLLLSVALLRPQFWWRARQDAQFWLLPATLYMTLTIASSVNNIGYRYLLPIIPFVALLVAFVATRPQIKRWRTPVVAGATSIWVALSVFPHYTPFFNLPTRFSGEEWRYLSDSNIDWGQDLPLLAAWQAAHEAQPIKLSYFGSAPPSAYGITFDALPTWPPTPEQTPPNRQAFYPPNPAPGIYAISVTHLHGVVLGAERDTYDYFREKEPLAVLGQSIRIYEVVPNGKAADLALSNAVPRELPQRWLQSNALQIRWFDASQSMVWGGNMQSVISAETESPFSYETVDQADNWLLIQPQPQNATVAHAALFNHSIELVGYTLAADGESILLDTHWQVVQPISDSTKFFVHWLDSDGTLLTQWDGAGIALESLRAGDRFVHRHLLPAVDAPLRLRVGLYDAQTGIRWTLGDGTDSAEFP